MAPLYYPTAGAAGPSRVITPARIAAAVVAGLLLSLMFFQLQPGGQATFSAALGQMPKLQLGLQQACDCSQCDAPNGAGSGAAGPAAPGPAISAADSIAPAATSAGAPAGAAADNPPGRRSTAVAAAATAAIGEAGGLAQYKQDIVARLWEHQHFLSPRSLRQGLYTLGEPARMRRFVHKLLSGQPVSVSAVGGSVTAGQGAAHGGPYLKRWHDFIQKVSPGLNHTLKSPAFGGSTSGIFTVCVPDMIQEDVDLVVVEFAINDTPTPGVFTDPLRLGMERMLRKLLSQWKNRPAVVLLNHYAWAPAGGVGGAVASYVHTAENDFNVLAQYYALPSLSIRGAAYHLMVKNVTGYQAHVTRGDHLDSTKEEDLYYWDTVHPQDRTGHAALSDLLAGLVQETTRGLAARPLSQEDEDIAQEALPLPMTPGNYERRSSTCLLSLAFKPVAVANQGFQWKEERNNKWGWIGEEEGSWVELEVDTTTDLQGSLKANTTELVLSFLKSYENMGKAKVECISGCQCESSELDGWWADKNSQTELHRFQVTPDKKCRVRATVLPESSSPDGGKKVKLVGVMVVEGFARVDAHGNQLEIFSNRGRLP